MILLWEANYTENWEGDNWYLSRLIATMNNYRTPGVNSFFAVISLLSSELKKEKSEMPDGICLDSALVARRMSEGEKPSGLFEGAKDSPEDEMKKATKLAAFVM